MHVQPTRIAPAPLTLPLPATPPSRIEQLHVWLKDAPLVPPAMGMVAGIGGDAIHHVPTWLAMVAFLLAGLGIGRLRRAALWRHVSIAVAAAALGTVMHDTAFRRWPADHIVQYATDEPMPARIVGVVLREPTVRTGQSSGTKWIRETPSTRLEIDVQAIQGIQGDLPASGTVVVVVHEPVLTVSTGDRVEVFGTLFRPGKPRNVGELDWSLIQQRNGILVQMSCQHADNVVVLQERHQIATHWLDRFRRWTKVAMLADTFRGDVPGSQLLEAMVLGQRSAVDDKLNTAWVATGTVHYLSVSGAHVGMLASVVVSISVLGGMSRRQCALTAIIVITTYALLAEPMAAIWRAALIADVFCLAVLLRRPLRTANWLALSVLIILAVQPTELFSVSFQLSYTTLLAVIYLSPQVHTATGKLIRHLRGRNDPLLSNRIQHMLTPPTTIRQVLTRKIGRSVRLSLSVSIAAWAVGTLVGTYHFHQFAPWGWLNTLLITPLVWLDLVLGLLKTVVTAIFPPASLLLGPLLRWVTWLVIAVVSALARLPMSGYPTPAIPAWTLWGGLTLALAAMLGPWLRIRARNLIWIACLYGIVSAWAISPRPADGILRLHMLAVGAGNTTVIELPNGHTLLYDAGAFPPYDVERWTLGPLLAQQHIYKIDAAILSHPNLDHFSAIPDLVQRRSVGQIVTSTWFVQQAHTGGSAARLPDCVRQAGVPWRIMSKGNHLEHTGEVTIEALWPPAPGQAILDKDNDTSIVLRISYADKRVLLCGDIEELPQQILLGSEDLRADVLLLPHHGSIRPSTEAFLAAVNPTVCVRSSNKPTSPQLQELVGQRHYFNTAEDGGIEIAIDQTGLRWHAHGSSKEQPR